MKYNMKFFVWPILFISIFSFASCIASENKEKKMEVPLKDAIKIANAKAIDLGYDILGMRLEADEKNAAWNNYVKSGPLLESNPDLKKKLEKREFWVIGYGPKKMQLGGDLTIFIDKYTGEVITTIQGE